MSEKSDPRTRLVTDVFHEAWATGPAHTFALRAAAHARRRRIARRALLTGGVAAMLVVAAVLAIRRSAPAPYVSASPLQSVVSASPAPVQPALSPATASPATARPLSSKVSPAFEIISDEELFAELRGRPLLILLQASGARRIVVLTN